jgi:AraC family transcriptional regulator, transcriptional activator FtrA
MSPVSLFTSWAGREVCTSAGSAAALDLCLEIVRRDYGAQVAQIVSKRLVFAGHRPGGQKQFVDSDVVTPANTASPLAASLAWACEHLDQPITVPDLAEKASMSISSFHRAFKVEVGSTPLRWLQRQRVHQALRLLETSDFDLTAISHRCGFQTVATLRTYVHEVTGLSPIAYRAAFSHNSDVAGIRPLSDR